MGTISDLEFFERDSADRLCLACQSLFATGSLERCRTANADETVYLSHHDSFASFKHATLDDCYICVAVKADLGAKQLTSSQARFYHAYGDLCLDIVPIVLDNNDVHERQYPSRFYASEINTHAPLYRLSIMSLRQQHMNNIDTTALARRWLTTCLSEQHGQCGTETSALPTFVPTRLLDVSCGNVRIIETAEHFEPAPYATMSYRWGTEHFLRLETSNLDDFKTSIPIADMAGTFQDVISLIRAMDIRYLWVDSFCIIQSGVEAKLDWHREGVEMSRIYTHAILNIGSAHGNDALSGCFSERQRQVRPPLCVPWRPGPKDTPGVFHIHPVYGISRYLQLYHRNTMFTRAWVFQERVLCPRMLYFASDQIYWECSGSGQMLACEEYPSGMRQPRLKVDLYPWSLQGENSRLCNSRQEPLELWAALVRHYSGLNLTYPHVDKLFALGGVAQCMSELLSDEYVAGMFREHLVTQLPWIAGSDSGRALPWRAPTWSWASMDGEIELPFMVFHDLATVSHVELQYVHDENPYGALLSGSLQLVCRPIPCDMLPRQGNTSFLSMADHLIEWHPDDVDESQTATSEPWVVFTNVFGIDQTIQRRDQRLTRDGIMSIAKDPTSLRHDRTSIALEGVVIRKCDQDSYVRIGALVRATSSNHLALWYRMKSMTITMK